MINKDFRIKGSANYLNFDRSRMVNLQYSLEREILRTNRRGAYHCTTIAECNTRKQHGLLVMPVEKLGNKPHVLLSCFNETIIQYGAPFNLGIVKYNDDHFSPQGNKYIREFSCDGIPKIIYRVGGVVLSKERMFSLENNTIFIRYTLLDAYEPTTMQFSPFLAFRAIDELTVENSTINHGYKEEDNGISMCLYSNYPRLYMQFGKENVNFNFEPRWYKGIEYLKDQQEGLPYKEDLYVPGQFQLQMEKGESIVFSASDTPADVNSLSEQFEEGVKMRVPRSSFYNCLKNSAHQFYYKPKDGGTYILNGYPWGRVTARAQIMGLEGLTISINKPDVFEDVLDTTIPVVKAFINNDPIDTLIEGIDEPDVLLGILRNIRSFIKIEPERGIQKYKSIVHDIVSFILENKHPRLKVAANKLLITDGTLIPASWMNGMINGRPVVPRTGFLVELNTFWYNALMCYRELIDETADPESYKKITRVAREVKEAFLNTFLNEAGYLFDYVDGDRPSWAVRPNMLYAVSSEFELLDKKTAKQIMEIVTKELLTTKGLRTRSPKSGDFKPRYEGNRDEKEYAEFNGMVRAWLIAPYLDAYLKVFNNRGLGFIERILSGIEAEMSNDCIGSLSEMYDGSMPAFGHGLISSAIDVSGVLRALKLRDNILNQL